MLYGYTSYLSIQSYKLYLYSMENCIAMFKTIIILRYFAEQNSGFVNDIVFVS